MNPLKSLLMASAVIGARMDASSDGSEQRPFLHPKIVVACNLEERFCYCAQPSPGNPNHYEAWKIENIGTPEQSYIKLTGDVAQQIISQCQAAQSNPSILQRQFKMYQNYLRCIQEKQND